MPQRYRVSISSVNRILYAVPKSRNPEDCYAASSEESSRKYSRDTTSYAVAATDQPFRDKQRWIEQHIPGAETGVALFTPEGHEKRIGEFHSMSFWWEDVFATAKALCGSPRLRHSATTKN